MRPWAPCPMGAINSYPEAEAGQAWVSNSISFEFALKVVFAVEGKLIYYSLNDFSDCTFPMFN